MDASSTKRRELDTTSGMVDDSPRSVILPSDEETDDRAPGVTVLEDAKSENVYTLPGRIPTKALIISVLALSVAGITSVVWPAPIHQHSVLVWLLAVIPAFMFAYYRGWQGATVALVATMMLLSLVEIGMSFLRTGDVAWWLFGSVTSVLIAVSCGAGLISEAHRRKTAEALKLAYADPLTGLPNRRILDLFLSHEFAASNRGRECAIMLLDVDGFKAINDTEGHQAGDEVLRAVAQALEQNTRLSDLSGRYGGDEFLALLPGASVRGALAFAERVRKSIEERFEGAPVNVTVSCGVAVSSSHTKTKDDLLQAADVALYSAKREGGNEAVVGGPWSVKDVELEDAAAG